MKDWKEIRKYPLLVIFAVVMLAIFCTDMYFTSNPYSELENRKLKQKPVFTVADLISNKYTKEYEKYINDQFAGRDQWISLKSIGETALGKTENNGVAYGKDHYLFAKMYEADRAETRNNGTGFGGDGSDTGSATVLSAVSREQLERNGAFLNKFLGSYPGHVTVALAPNSYTVLREKLPLGLCNIDQEKAIGEFYATLAGKNLATLDLLPAMKAAAGSYQAYYRTDHHWTTDGAWAAYYAYAQSRGLKAATLEELARYRKEEPNFLGTYYSKTKNFDVLPDSLVWYDIPVEEVTIDGKKTVLEADGTTAEVTGLYQKEKLKIRDKYAAFLYGNNGLTVVKSENNLNRQEGKTSRVLLVKDSYGNSLAPFLTYSYDEVYVADLRSMTFKISELTAKYDFDDVLVLYNFDTFQGDKNLSRITY